MEVFNNKVEIRVLEIRGFLFPAALFLVLYFLSLYLYFFHKDTTERTVKGCAVYINILTALIILK